MNRFSMFMAFNVFVIVSLFVYNLFPREWHTDKRKKAALIFYHVIGIFSLELTFMMYKDVPYPWLQRLSVIISTFYYVPIMIMGILFAVCVVLRILLGRRRDRSLKNNYYASQRLAGIVIAAAYLLTTFGFFNANALHVVSYEVDLPEVELEEPLNICFFADIHAGSGNWDSLYSQLAERVEEMNPDVILIGGDVFDETTGKHDIKMFSEVLEGMEAPLGVYYVLGNHDDPDSREFNEILKESGAVNIEEREIYLGERIRLVGRRDDGQERMNAEELLRTVNPDDAVLVMEHRPTEFSALKVNGADLVMAGHTHGFNIPMIAAVYWKADLVYGRKTYDTMTAVVTSGVSGWGFHYKCPAKNEIVQIRIY